MKKTRFKMIAAAYLLYVRRGKILMIRRFQTGYADGEYSLPAGHVEDGETLTECLIREAKEEVNVTVLAEDISLVHVMHRKSNDIRIDFFFLTHRSGTTPKNMEEHKADDMRWFRMNDLPKNTVPYLRKAIEFYRKNIFYSEFGWDMP
jgi:ADP-ribose pyrophosphatase YjhB (NUDIX family)